MPGYVRTAPSSHFAEHKTPIGRVISQNATGSDASRFMRIVGIPLSQRALCGPMSGYRVCTLPIEKRAQSWPTCGSRAQV